MSLGHREFRRAMKGIQKELSKSALARLGLSRRTLVLAVAGAGFVLLLVLVFIFLGITSLTTGSAFGAVINAVLPMTAGECFMRWCCCCGCLFAALTHKNYGIQVAPWREEVVGRKRRTQRVMMMRMVARLAVLLQEP